MKKTLTLSLFLGSTLWIAAEGFKIVNPHALTLVMSTAAAAFLILSVGVWAFNSSLSLDGGWLSSTALSLLSIGFMVLFVGSIDILSGTPESETIQKPWFLLGGLLFALGFVVLGIQLIRAKKLAWWIGGIAIASPIFSLVIIAMQIHGRVENISNLLLGFAMIASSLYLLEKGRLSVNI